MGCMSDCVPEPRCAPPGGGPSSGRSGRDLTAAPGPGQRPGRLGRHGAGQRTGPPAPSAAPAPGVPKARLVATLAARGVDWIEDPSNRGPPKREDPPGASWLPDLAREGLTPARLAATAGRLGRAREALGQGLAALLARSVALDPAGFAWLDAEALGRAPRGQAPCAHWPGCSRPSVAAPMGHGWSVWKRLYGRITKRRFPRRHPGRVPASAQAGRRARGARGGLRLFPSRFGRATGCCGTAASRFLSPGRLAGRAGRWSSPPWATRVGATCALRDKPLKKRAFHRPARLALPALWEAGAPVCVPHLDFTMTPRWAGSLENCHFRPKNGLIGTWFRVA